MSVLAVCGVAASANAALTTWEYGGAKLQYVNSDGGWEDFDFDPSVGATVLDDGLKVFGTGDENNVFSFVGESYITGTSTDPDVRGVQLVIHGSGTFDGAQWQHPGDSIKTTFKFNFDFDGGTLEVYKAETSFSLFDAQDNGLIGVGSGGYSSGVLDPGGYGVGFAYEDRFGSNFETATHFTWEVRIGFDWNGQVSTNALNFGIPPNSIDFNVVPAPGAIGLAAFAGVVAGRRNRR